MKAFVAGATGETGRRIVQELVHRQIPVRALVRNVEAARAILPPDVEFVTGDVLDRASLDAAIADSTIILCATGARPGFDPTAPYKVDFEGTQNLVDVAKSKGIEQFVLVTSLCVSKFFHPLNLFFLILVWKKQAETYLQNSGLTYTIVRPGGLKSVDSPEPPVQLVMSQPDTLFEGSIPRLLVAKACVEALFTPAARNKIVEVVAREDAPATSIADLYASVA